MSSTYGNAPPALGAADLHVDPQALWDVGLALQRVRDAVGSYYVTLRQSVDSLNASAVSDDIGEIHGAWTQLVSAIGYSDRGLQSQVDALRGVLDSTMINLRVAIEAYLEMEGTAQRRVRDAAGG
jgi:hypothetical protein